MGKISKINDSSNGNGSLGIGVQGIPRATLLFRRLRPAIEGVLGPMTLRQLALLFDLPKSTVGNWLTGAAIPPIEVILRCLEVLPPVTRVEILNQTQFCRAFPTLNHAKLAHDEATTSQLRTLLQGRNALILVQGQSDQAITFVSTALGHSFKQLRRYQKTLAGIDKHNPDWFVSVPGVKYLCNAIQMSQVRNEFEKYYPRFQQLNVPFVLFNGINDHVPNLIDVVQPLINDSIVVISNPGHFVRIPPSIQQKHLVHLLTVTPDTHGTDKIYIEFSR